MSKPTFTDAWRHAGRYNTAAESREPGYLKRRFAEIREREQIEKELAELRAQERAEGRPIPFQRPGRRPITQ